MQQGETLAPAARLGGELRAAREKLGWALPELAQGLRIRQVYLEAIEAGRVAELPGATYALGFLRTYAAALGLPAEEVARRFRAEAQVERQPALSFPVPVPQRGVPAGALMLLGLVILGAAYGGWYWFTEHRAAHVETVPPIPDRLAQTGEKPTSPSPQVASLLPSTAAPAPAPPASTAPVSPPATRNPPAAAPGKPATAMPVPQTAAPPKPSPPPAEAAAAPSPAAGRIVVKATADAWVTVKPANGPAVLNRLMHAGDTWPVPPDAAGLRLTTGNAGGTEIDVDGAPIPVALGGSGMVRRDLPLDADGLKAGQLPPPATRHAKSPPPPAD